MKSNSKCAFWIILSLAMQLYVVSQASATQTEVCESGTFKMIVLAEIVDEGSVEQHGDNITDVRGQEFRLTFLDRSTQKEIGTGVGFFHRTLNTSSGYGRMWGEGADTFRNHPYISGEIEFSYHWFVTGKTRLNHDGFEVFDKGAITGLGNDGSFARGQFESRSPKEIPKGVFNETVTFYSPSCQKGVPPFPVP